MLGATLPVGPYFERMAAELARLDADAVRTLSDLIHAQCQAGRMVFVVGNGGSGSNASHFTEDVGKGCVKLPEDLTDDAKKRVRILSLTDNTAYITAWANDEGYERVFVEQLRNLASPGDLLVAISGSGNSPNILKAVEWANRNGLTTFGCTGYTGGELRRMAHHVLHVDLADMGLVETLHLAAFHWVVGDLHRRIALGQELPTPATGEQSR